jgi:hypothetical protein
MATTARPPRLPPVRHYHNTEFGLHDDSLLEYQSGEKKTVLVRHVHSGPLIDALTNQAFAALTTSPGARASCGQLLGQQQFVQGRLGLRARSAAAEATACHSNELIREADDSRR